MASIKTLAAFASILVVGCIETTTNPPNNLEEELVFVDDPDFQIHTMIIDSSSTTAVVSS